MCEGVIASVLVCAFLRICVCGECVSANVRASACRVLSPSPRTGLSVRAVPAVAAVLDCDFCARNTYGCALREDAHAG